MWGRDCCATRETARIFEISSREAGWMEEDFDQVNADLRFLMLQGGLRA